jgi:hypothetical protein
MRHARHWTWWIPWKSLIGLAIVLLGHAARAQVPPPKGSSGGGGSGTVTGVLATPPIVSDGSATTPTISCTSATTGTAGCVSAGAQSFSGAKTFLASGTFSAGLTVSGGATVISGGTVTITETGTTVGLQVNASTDGNGDGPVIIKSLLSGDTGAGIEFDGTANAAGKKWWFGTVNSSGSFGLFDRTRSVYAFFCLDGTSPTCASGPAANTNVSASFGFSAVSSFRTTDGANGTMFSVDNTGKATFPVTDGSASTGDQTINKPSFKAAVAASGTTITITNSTIVATSIPICQVLTADATCKSVQAVPAAGSVAISCNAAATGITKIGCVVH